MPKILLTNYYTEEPLRLIKSLLPDGFSLLHLDRPGKEEIIRLANQADYMLVGGRVKIDREIIDAAKNLKMIQRSGVGLDSIDIGLLRERNIPFFVNQGINARSVAEHTIMLILAVLRKLPLVDASVRSGLWKKHDFGINCNDLYGKKVGLVGLGSIGGLVARMLEPFGVQVLYYKRTRLSAAEEIGLKLTYVSLSRMLHEADIISLHCPYSVDTNHLIDATALSQMKPGAILVNTSRGKLVDESALIESIRSGRVKGAGLDVFEDEPLPQNSALYTLDNVVLTPHIASITSETFSNLISAAFIGISEFHKARN